MKSTLYGICAVLLLGLCTTGTFAQDNFDLVITPDGLDTMKHWQLYGGYSHYWNDSFNSTLSVAWAELDDSEFQPGSAIHKAGSFHLNLIWFPYKLVSTGIEYLYGLRENKDGAEGKASRIQYMIKYKFNG